MDTKCLVCGPSAKRGIAPSWGRRAAGTCPGCGAPLEQDAARGATRPSEDDVLGDLRSIAYQSVVSRRRDATGGIELPEGVLELIAASGPEVFLVARPLPALPASPPSLPPPPAPPRWRGRRWVALGLTGVAISGAVALVAVGPGDGAAGSLAAHPSLEAAKPVAGPDDGSRAEHLASGSTPPTASPRGDVDPASPSQGAPRQLTRSTPEPPKPRAAMPAPHASAGASARMRAEPKAPAPVAPATAKAPDAEAAAREEARPADAPAPTPVPALLDAIVGAVNHPAPSSEAPSAVPQEEAPPFDRGAALAALASVATGLAGCKASAQENGPGAVSLTFTSSGSVSQASVDGPLAGTDTGRCIAQRFRGARVPAFAGSPVVVHRSFLVP